MYGPHAPPARGSYTGGTMALKRVTRWCAGRFLARCLQVQLRASRDGCAPRPMHNDRVSTGSRLHDHDTPNEALRTILPIAGWVIRRQRMSCSPVVSILCCRRRSTSAQPVRLLSLQAGSRPRNCGRFVRAASASDSRSSQATAALRSGHYFSLPAWTFHPSETPSWASIRPATALVYLHCNFPNHRARHSACSA